MLTKDRKILYIPITEIDVVASRDEYPVSLVDREGNIVSISDPRYEVLYRTDSALYQELPSNAYSVVKINEVEYIKLENRPLGIINLQIVENINLLSDQYPTDGPIDMDELVEHYNKLQKDVVGLRDSLKQNNMNIDSTTSPSTLPDIPLNHIFIRTEDGYKGVPFEDISEEMKDLLERFVREFLGLNLDGTPIVPHQGLVKTMDELIEMETQESLTEINAAAKAGVDEIVENTVNSLNIIEVTKDSSITEINNAKDSAITNIDDKTNQSFADLDVFTDEKKQEIQDYVDGLDAVPIYIGMYSSLTELENYPNPKRGYTGIVTSGEINEYYVYDNTIWNLVSSGSDIDIEKATKEEIREGSDTEKMVTPKAVKDAFFYGSNYNFMLDGYSLPSKESPKLYLGSYYKDDIILGYHAQKALNLGSHNVGSISVGYNATGPIFIGSAKGDHSTKKLISGDKEATFEDIIDAANNDGGGGEPPTIEFATEAETFNLSVTDKAVSPSSLNGVFKFNSHKIMANYMGDNPGDVFVGYAYKGDVYYGKSAQGLIHIGDKSTGGISVGSESGNQSKNKLIAGTKSATFEQIIDKAHESGGGDSVEFATEAETYAMTIENKAVSPKSLKGVFKFSSEKLISNDDRNSPGEAYIGYSYKGVQYYGNHALGQINIGANSQGGIVIGSNSGVQSKNKLIAGTKSATFEQIIDKAHESGGGGGDIEKATMQEVRAGTDTNKMVTPNAVKTAFFDDHNYNFTLDGDNLTEAESPKLFLGKNYKDGITLGYNVQKNVTVGSHTQGNVSIGFESIGGITLGSTKGDHSTKKLVSGTKHATFEQIIDKAHETGGGTGLEKASETEVRDLYDDEKYVTPKSLNGLFENYSEEIVGNDWGTTSHVAHLGLKYNGSFNIGQDSKGGINIGTIAKGRLYIGSGDENAIDHKLFFRDKSASFEDIINKANEVTTLGGVTDGSLLNRVLFVEAAGEVPTKAEIEEAYGRELAVIHNYIIIDESKKKRWDVVIGKNDIYITDERNLHSLI